MTVYFEADGVTLHLGDCLLVMAGMEADSVDAIVTDPPYGLSFMGKDWDKGVPGVAFWAEALRVAKPGAHLLAFGGTRTFHRLMVAIEDAGWEIRDCIGWIYGSGFPKSLDVSKAIDRMMGAERDLYETDSMYTGSEIGRISRNLRCKVCGKPRQSANPCTCQRDSGPATPEAAQWSGWGTALKPSWEPIILARKPLVGTVARNVLEYGTGAINVDGCRVPGNVPSTTQGQSAMSGDIYGKDQRIMRKFNGNADGRWPANTIHDGSEEVLAVFPETASNSRESKGGDAGTSWFTGDRKNGAFKIDDSGSAARFFYCAKASREDRNEGLEEFAPVQKVYNGQSAESAGCATGSVEDKFSTAPAHNHHPTVKPTDLMRYLCRMVTPPGGIVFDPFMGSGSTGKAAALEGFAFVGIEIDERYIEIARARIERAKLQPRLFTPDGEPTAEQPQQAQLFGDLLDNAGNVV